MLESIFSSFSEINQTREDTLKSFEDYAQAFPSPNNPPDSTTLQAV